MYKVFINEKVICFTNNKDYCNLSDHYLALHFFNPTDIPLLINFLENDEKTNVVLIVKDYTEAFKTFQHHFKIIEAAGGIVTNPNLQQLFIYRLGKWDLPKGKIEKGESIESAAMREIEEECGIENLTITGKLPNTYHIYRQENKLILKQTHWFELTSNYDGELVPQTAEGITKVAWLTQTQIKKQVVHNTYASIKELIMGFITNQ